MAEGHGFDFALSMIKLRGFGGDTEHWDYNLESFTLMAGLAAATSRIKLFASTAILTLPPALCARMATTIDSIADCTAESEEYKGRFGVNIVTGWQTAEYSQMGLWPGNQYFGYRYEYAEEYVRVMKSLWETGKCDMDGKYFKMDDCRLEPRPSRGIKIIAAGQSDRGTKFASEYADYNFTSSKGVNTPTAFAENNQRLLDAAKATGRDVGPLVSFHVKFLLLRIINADIDYVGQLLIMIIMDETNEKAEEKWHLYCDNVDWKAVDWVHSQAGKDVNAGENSTARRLKEGAGAAHPVNLGGGVLIGGYEKIASLLDEIAMVEGVKGVMLTFDDFLLGVDRFGKYVQPKMKSRVGKMPTTTEDSSKKRKI